MTPYVIIADVANSEINREDLENVENQNYGTLEVLQTTLKTTDFEIYTLSEFMDLWNNEELPDPTTHWFGYVNIEESI
jgi:hypothetical protein